MFAAAAALAGCGATDAGLVTVSAPTTVFAGGLQATQLDIVLESSDGRHSQVSAPPAASGDLVFPVRVSLQFPDFTGSITARVDAYLAVKKVATGTVSSMVVSDGITHFDVTLAPVP
jgi:hypothetical protein